MGLRDLNLKPAYDSDEDDLVNEFYIPVLSNSIIYRRLAGFFSSTALYIAAQGILGLIKNNGKMQLVAGAILRKSDIEAINACLATKEEIVGNSIKRELENINEEFIKNHVKALGWMVANNLLEIKIAFRLDEGGNLLDEETITSRGLFHMKIGILEDSDGNIVSFSGSINESLSGWKENIENGTPKVFVDFIKKLDF